MMCGNLGQFSGGFFESIVDKVLKGEQLNVECSGVYLVFVDIEVMCVELFKEFEGFSVDDEDFNGYLMYLKVFKDYMGCYC